MYVPTINGYWLIILNVSALLILSVSGKWYNNSSEHSQGKKEVEYRMENVTGNKL